MSAQPKLPCMNKPCSDCPFRKDSLEGWLGEKRMTEILDVSTFVCHKKPDLQCAGFMLIKKEESEFYRLAKRLYSNDFVLKGSELVFDNKTDCISHHKH